jgi:DNA-binding MarR family transcriptional regulator
MLLEFDSLLQGLVKDNSCQLKELLNDLVTPTQFFLLKLIATQENCKAADVAHILDISPSAATTILDRLCKNGWIKRNRSIKDRRIVWLKVTENGTKLLSDIEAKRFQLLAKQFDNIAQGEIEMICEVFKRILIK